MNRLDYVDADAVEFAHIFIRCCRIALERRAHRDAVALGHFVGRHWPNRRTFALARVGDLGIAFLRLLDPSPLLHFLGGVVERDRLTSKLSPEIGRFLHQVAADIELIGGELVFEQLFPGVEVVVLASSADMAVGSLMSPTLSFSKRGRASLDSFLASWT